jgi:hypothetical protein
LAVATATRPLEDCDLSDAQHRMVTTLYLLARERPGEVPSNRAIAERSGWLCAGTGKPNTSKVKRIARELESLGVVKRGLEDDGKQVRRVSLSINLPRPEFDPPPSGPPAQIQPTHTELARLPEKPAHWVDAVRFRVRSLLSAVASEGGAIPRERLSRVAGLVQAELAGSHCGNGSDLFFSLVEAVAVGYPVEVIDAAIARAGEGRCPNCRVDVRQAVWRLTPDPRDFLQRQGRTEWPSRDAQKTTGWY